MPDNQTIIAALKAAVERSPDDIDLRLHLAEQLMQASRADEAMAHCAHILTVQPAHGKALVTAAEAARESGDEKRAAAYTRLASGLGKNASISGADTPVPAPAGGRALRLVGGKEPVYEEPDDHTITLADVAGLEDVKKRLDLAFLGPIRNPELAKAYGKRLRGGLMLYGPPGCGKTYIARALAGELSARFISVAINDVLDMWMGESEKRLHGLFETARENAPTVLFFDELDAIGRKRADLGSSAAREVVNQLLSELDGVNTGDEAVFVLGATNLPWDVDSALKRPGRFDRSIFVCPPDELARDRILSLNFADRPTESLDIRAIVKKTKGYSGADVAHICDTATEIALARAMDSGTVQPITNGDVINAMKEIRPSIGKWFETAKNYALFGNNSGEFNDLAKYIGVNRI